MCRELAREAIGLTKFMLTQMVDVTDSNRKDKLSNDPFRQSTQRQIGSTCHRNLYKYRHDIHCLDTAAEHGITQNVV